MAENFLIAQYRNMMLSEKEADKIVAEFDAVYAAADRDWKLTLDEWLAVLRYHAVESRAQMGDKSIKLLLWQTLKYQGMDAMDRCDAVAHGEAVRDVRERAEYELSKKADRARMIE